MRFLILGKGEPLEAAIDALATTDYSGIHTTSERITIETVRYLQPDVGITIGYNYLLDPETISIPPLGWYNIHSSLLPKYKGRAPINWAIINGETTLGVTLHRIDNTIDGGPILKQHRYTLEPHEDAGDALRKCLPIYRQLVSELVQHLRTSHLPVTPQPPNKATIWPARTDQDGEINWDAKPETTLNLIRACAPPYPGAWTTCGDGRKLRILKARIE